MDIEKLYKDALAGGNHASAIQAVFQAGKDSVAVPQETPAQIPVSSFQPHLTYPTKKQTIQRNKGS